MAADTILYLYHIISYQWPLCQPSNFQNRTGQSFRDGRREMLKPCFVSVVSCFVVGGPMIPSGKLT